MTTSICDWDRSDATSVVPYEARGWGVAFPGVDVGSIELSELRSLLRARRRKAWITAVAKKDKSEDGMRLLNAQVVVGVRPSAWRDHTWAYEECIFSTAISSTSKLAAPLGSPGTQMIRVGPVDAFFELPETNFSWQRLPSLTRYSQLTLPWPSTEYTLTMVNPHQFRAPSGYLVGRDEAPSFPTFGSVFNAFFEGDFTVTGSQQSTTSQITVRIVDNRARITRVRIRPTSLDVWVGGHDLPDARLELNGADYRTTTALEKGGRITLPLPTGLPPDAWLWLKAGHEWLDFRALTGWGGHTSPDVETELPQDPIADLSRLATQGEGPHLEYKQKLPDTREEKRTVFKTVVAFANSEGGTVLFGVGDGGELAGLAGKPPELRSRLTDLLRDLVTPSPHTRISTHRLEGRTILVLEVSPSNGFLHALTVNANRPEYYVRRDGTTFFARPDEVAAVVHRGTIGTQSAYPLMP